MVPYRTASVDFFRFGGLWFIFNLQEGTHSTVPYRTFHVLDGSFLLPPELQFRRTYLSCGYSNGRYPSEKAFSKILTICFAGSSDHLHLSPFFPPPIQCRPSRTEPNRTEPLRSVGSRRLLLAQWMDRRLILFFSIHSTVP